MLSRLSSIEENATAEPLMFTQVDFKRMIQHIDSANRIIDSFTKDTALPDGVLKFLRLLV
jgi:hypothetical protein